MTQGKCHPPRKRWRDTQIPSEISTPLQKSLVWDLAFFFLAEAPARDVVPLSPWLLGVGDQKVLQKQLFTNL